ncbi:putative S-protein [Cardamine amara subsp. amara]|uniref:S-protein homolog n=1 Tax=Cardamine amara subsp. amara TaxID=228776 RepID=A0ABD0Z2B8_CARAN
MTNSLGGPVLTVHCKSKDDDLGPHAVPFNQNYHFGFKPNILKTTLFFCSFRWDKQFKWFDIFDAQRDEDICVNCNWVIKPDGPCRLGKKQKCFPWNKAGPTFSDVPSK